MLVRHQSPRWDLNRLLDHGQLEIYQANQSKARFNCDHIVSFIGEPFSRARFLGVFIIKECQHAPERPWPAHYLYQEAERGDYWYDLERLPGFEDLENRVVINWGASPRAWFQWLSPREVCEILPTGYVRDFPGYDDLIVSWHELKRITFNPVAHREWHRALKSVAGVYLITDTTTGQQYVGSAYGKDGIWGRWQAYATTGHGGNARLRSRLKDSPDGHHHFQLSLLRALPLSSTKDEVLACEIRYKQKLGSRAFGLNAN